MSEDDWVRVRRSELLAAVEALEDAKIALEQLGAVRHPVGLALLRVRSLVPAELSDPDKTPPRPPSVSALAATRHDSRSGMTAVGGLNVSKKR